MILLADGAWLTGLTLGALLLVIGWLLLRTHRHLSRQKGSGSPLVELARPPRTKESGHPDAPPDVLRWEVQMHETARELSAQLDSKMGALQALIDEADRAAARLEAAAAGARGEARQPPRPNPRPATQAEALRPAATASPAPDATDQRPQRTPARRDREEIYTLADYGLDAAEIARRLGSPVGEVQLILSLRDKQ